MSKILKLISIIIIATVVVTAAFFGFKIYHRSLLEKSVGNNRSANMRNGQNVIPTNGDLCQGTGGNGQIISIGKKMFTLKLNNGSNRIIYLTEQSIIKTSSGFASLTNLKTGERVTLVGGPNPDGSFTAQAVFVCK